MDFLKSKTYANLLAAYAGESEARNKYSFFASKARKDGYEQIGAIFDETANNEREHAEIWFKHINGGTVSGTLENLKAAAAGEHYEWTEMYKKFAEEAKEEGYTELEALFRMVAAIEKEHEKRFLTLAENLEKGIVFKRTGTVVWHCRNCGHLHVGESAPQICPVCKHPQSYFQMQETNY